MGGLGTDPARPGRRDAGFTLIEVVVAFALFALMATALLSVVVTSQKLGAEDSARVAATNLAARELEVARDTFSSVSRGPSTVALNRQVNPSPLPGGIAGNPLVVDDVPFTVVRTAQWSSLASDADSSCDPGATAGQSFLRVKVQVSWPALGSRPPVVMDTVMTPRKSVADATTGAVGLTVLDRDARPRADVSVVARATSGTTVTGQTAANGCVVFAYLAPGSWTLSVTRTGEVGTQAVAPATRTANVVAGATWQGTLEVDRAATITATLRTVTGHALPTGIAAVPLVLSNSAFVPSPDKAFAGTGSVRTVTNLFPFTSGYQAWAGGCSDASAVGAGATTVSTPAGATVPVTVPLAPLVVTTAAGTNQTIKATHVSGTACTGGAAITLGTTAPSTLRTSLPYGEWRISYGTRTQSVTIRLAPAQAIPSVVAP